LKNTPGFTAQHSEPTTKEVTQDEPERSIFERIAHDVGQLVREKNEAYGSAYKHTGQFLRILFPNGIHPSRYDDALILVRIFDKQMRIATRKDAFSESPYRDISGYGILGVDKDSVHEQRTEDAKGKTL
jgi:hypothetical protein